MSTNVSEKESGPSRSGSFQSSNNQQGKKGSFNDATEQVQTLHGGSDQDDDDAELARMGYKSEFAREFKSLSVSIFDLLPARLSTCSTSQSRAKVVAAPGIRNSVSGAQAS